MRDSSSAPPEGSTHPARRRTTTPQETAPSGSAEPGNGPATSEPSLAASAYFGGREVPALLGRDEEAALTHRLAERRRRIQSLLDHGLGVLGVDVPGDDGTDDFRERRALEVLAAARRVAADAAAGPAKSHDEAVTFIAEVEAALEEYRTVRDALLEANMRLVLALARRYRRTGAPMLDLVQEGTLGLLRAIEKFDPARDVRFSTYAAWWIWQQIGRAGDEHATLIRTPLHWHQLRRKLNREAQRFESLGVPFQREQLAEASGVAAGRVDAVSQSFICLSLSSPMANDDDDRTLEDTIPSESLRPEASMHAADLSEQLEKALAQLPQREADVLRLRFGTSESVPSTLEEIGVRYGVSRERVRQIEARALKRLLPICERTGLRSYFE